MNEAPLHQGTDRDVVVSMQDGNYRMVEIARVTPPSDAGAARAVTVTFDRTSGPRPTSIRVEYDPPASGGQQ